MTFTHHDDHTIRRHVANGLTDAEIAVALGCSDWQVARRRAEIGCKRIWYERGVSRQPKDTTPEEIEERKRQIQASWTAKDERKRLAMKGDEGYAFPSYTTDTALDAPGFDSERF